MIAHAQCALANNVEHFKMVLESVSCTEEDLLFTDAETGTDADAETFALEQLSTVLLSLHKCSMSFQKEKREKKHVQIQCNRQSNVKSQKNSNVFTVFRLSINMSTEK